MTNHSCRVDFYSYTLKGLHPFDDDKQHYMTILSQIAPKFLWQYRDEWDWKVPKRHNGYDMGFNVRQAIYVWFNGEDIHVEITGDGCTMLYDSTLLLEIISQTANQATRLDIAHDIVCDVRPSTFVALSKAKTSASGHQISETGETCYVGSKKSDRVVKVYRYNVPHPRADRLRIEYTYKSFDARIASNMLISSNEAILAFSSAKRYEWQHECFKSLKSPDLIEIRAHRKDRNTAKTVFWLKNTVFPAIEKVIQSGDYTAQDLRIDIRGVKHVLRSKDTASQIQKRSLHAQRYHTNAQRRSHHSGNGS